MILQVWAMYLNHFMCLIVKNFRALRSIMLVSLTLKVILN